MNTEHLHLILNHLPVLGTAFGLVVLAWDLWKRSDDIKRLAMALMVPSVLRSGRSSQRQRRQRSALDGRRGDQWSGPCSATRWTSATWTIQKRGESQRRNQPRGLMVEVRRSATLPWLGHKQQNREEETPAFHKSPIGLGLRASELDFVKFITKSGATKATSRGSGRYKDRNRNA